MMSNETLIPVSFAANVLDRLSDWIGSFLPGCSRLATRHPIRVSLIMGSLGLVSGWLTMAAGIIVNLAFGNDLQREAPVFLAGSVVVTVVLIVPWAVWLGVKFRWLPLIVVVCVLANAAAFGVIELLRDSGVMDLGLFVYGFLTGMYSTAVGCCMVRRFRPFWMLATSLISGGALSLFLLLRNNHLLETYLPRQAMMALVIAWFFSLLHSPTALCLGYLLWDRTPRDVVLPEELSEPEA